MMTEAEIRLRLLSMPGASLASEWTAHEIAEMKKNSVSFSFQAEQSLLIVRDRLIEWQGRPNRAKRLFKNDLDSWAYESSLSDQDLVHQQQAWSAQQAAANAPLPSAPAAPVLSNYTTATAPIAPASTQTAFTPGRFSRPSPAVSAPKEAGSVPAAPSSAVASSAATPRASEAADQVNPATEPAEDVIYARPVTASEASKRVDPPQDDITP
jgi:hypothetical protein